MTNDVRERPGSRPTASANWFTGVSIALVVVVCLAIFVYVFVRIEPYLSDFVSDDRTPVVEPTAPAEPTPRATPDGTPEG